MRSRPLRRLVPTLSQRAAIVGLLVTAVCAGAVTAGTAQARPFETGVVLTDAASWNKPQTWSRLKASNSRYVKLTTFWAQIAPSPDSATKPAGFVATDPGSPFYNFTSLDVTVSRARAAGLQPILTITNSPKWARASCVKDSSCAPTPADFADFATAIATRYGGAFDPGTGTLPRVSYFQGWVEPNLDFFFNPIFANGRPVAPDNYRDVLNAFYEAIHAVHSDNQVISAGLTPLAHPGSAIAPLDFMRRLLCMQGRVNPQPKPGCNQRAKLDIWATNPYTSGGPTHQAPGPDDVSLGDLPEMSKLLRAADKAGHIENQSSSTPFWGTEFSWDSNPPDPKGLKPGLLARWTAEAFYRAWKAGMSAFLWFSLRDDARKGLPNHDVFQSGLYLRGATIAKDKPKRVLSAFRFPFVALRTPKGFTFWGRTPDGAPHSAQIELKGRHGGYHRVKTLDSDGDGIFRGLVKTPARTGSVRANIAGFGRSLPFSLTYVKDFYQPPFGRSKFAKILTRRF